MNTSRRQFIKKASFTSLAFSLGSLNSCFPEKKAGKLRFGVIADVHKDSVPDAEQRLAAFIDEANREKPDFIIQLGDLTHGKNFAPMLVEWNRFSGNKYHVLGNHDMDYASKETVIEALGMPGKYYSFDVGDYHVIVLDANYLLKEGQYLDFDHGNYYVPYPNRDLVNPEQIEWLRNDIASTEKPCLLFSHEAFDEVWEGSTVPNRLEIRKVIREASAKEAPRRKVIASFCGHHHVDWHSLIEDVHYFQINSASGFTFGQSDYKDPLFAFVTIDADRGRISVKGKKSEFLQPLIEEQRKRGTGMICAEILDRDIVI